jgi:hypothetical protein
MKLTADNVVEVFMDCLFTEDEMIAIGLEHYTAEQVLAMEDPPFLVASGIVNDVALHPERLETHRGEVREMLRQLPKEFQSVSAGGGGGWSFLNMCMRDDGEQWTGLHRTQEHLATLAIALKEGSWLLPREMWEAFPGGMPYFSVSDNSVPLGTVEMKEHSDDERRKD